MTDQGLSLKVPGRTCFRGAAACGTRLAPPTSFRCGPAASTRRAGRAYASLSSGDNSPTLNHAGMVAFWAGLPAGASGVFTGPDLSASMVIRTGDLLFGATVIELHLGGVNNRGEIAFRAVLSNGRQVIGVGTPPSA
jgi:hypothetical protein